MLWRRGPDRDRSFRSSQMQKAKAETTAKPLLTEPGFWIARMPKPKGFLNRFGVSGVRQHKKASARMHLQDITGNLGDFTKDCILITKAEPWDQPIGPEIVWCNNAFTEMTGYTLDEIVGKTPRILQGHDTPREPLDKIRTALESWQPVVTVVKNYTKSGEPFWSELSIVPVADASGWFHYWVSVQRNVTRRVEQENHLKARNNALHSSERALQEEKVQLAGIAAVAQHAQDLITITDTDFRILWANPAFIRRSGFPAAAVRGSLHCELLNKRGEVYSSREMAQRAVVNGEFREGEVRNTDRDGEEFWTDVRVSVQRNEFGRTERFVVVERDITEQRAQRLTLERSQRDIAIAAIRDPLTGLLNRRGLEDAFQRFAADAGAKGHGIGLLHIDLDRFKQINDTLGHEAGDRVLTAVSERIQGLLGPDCVAARVGGDEFVVVVSMWDEGQDLQLFSDRLIEKIRKPVRYENSDCRFSASIGHVQVSSAPFDFGKMLVSADIALYEAKRGGRNMARTFDNELAKNIRRKKTLADQLSISIDNGDLFPVYHGQFDASSGDLIGAEALVRWQHPERGLLSPEHFLDIARELNLEPIVDKIVLDKSIHDHAVFRAHGIHLPKVSVNISARRLRSKDLAEEIAGLQIPEGSMCFELLESTFLDDSDEALMWTLGAFRERGIGIEIDDFGTGHASISGLLQIKPDGLKIDKSLVGPALHDPSVKRLLSLIVEIGNALSVRVTAEGIETNDHVALARDMGCTTLQGFHFCKPLVTFDFIEAFATSEAYQNSA